MLRIWPVSHAASGEARNATAAAIRPRAPSDPEDNATRLQLPSLVQGTSELGLDDRRRDRVHPNARSQLNGERPRQLVKCGLLTAVEADTG